MKMLKQLATKAVAQNLVVSWCHCSLGGFLGDQIEVAALGDLRIDDASKLRILLVDSVELICAPKTRLIFFSLASMACTNDATLTLTKTFS
jgi:hypothetical protein